MYETGLVFLTAALTISLLIREANWRAPICETFAKAEHLPLGSTYEVDLGNAQEISIHPSY